MDYKEYRKQVTFTEHDDSYFSKWDGNSGYIRIYKSKDSAMAIKYLEELLNDTPILHTTYQNYNVKNGVTHNHVYKFHIEECLKRFKARLVLKDPLSDVNMLKDIIKTIEPTALISVYKKIKGE